VGAQTGAAIRKAVDNDPDSFVPDAAWLRRARLVMPQRKETVTLRLDPDVLSWFRREDTRQRRSASLRAGQRTIAAIGTIASTASTRR
jgi:uncharacterized protein (DUF4415 family)